MTHSRSIIRSIYDAGMSTTPGPLARVTLPDGQTLDCTVTGRSQELDGTWWYDLEIVLLSKVEVRGAYPRAEPQPVQFRAPYPTVQPIPGQSYTRRPSPEEEKPPAEVYAESLRHLRGPRFRIHGPDCWASLNRILETLTPDAAQAMVRSKEAEICNVCRPDRSLQARQHVLLDLVVPLPELGLATLRATAKRTRFGVRQKPATSRTLARHSRTLPGRWRAGERLRVHRQMLLLKAATSTAWPLPASGRIRPTTGDGISSAWWHSSVSGRRGAGLGVLVSFMGAAFQLQGPAARCSPPCPG